MKPKQEDQRPHRLNQELKSQRAGHIARMKNNRRTKITAKCIPRGRARTQGRLKKR